MRGNYSPEPEEENAMEHMSVSDLFTLLGACVLVGIGFCAL